MKPKRNCDGRCEECDYWYDEISECMVDEVAEDLYVLRIMDRLRKMDYLVFEQNDKEMREQIESNPWNVIEYLLDCYDQCN